MRNRVKFGALIFSCIASNMAFADIVIPVYLTAASGQGKEIGTVTATDTAGGLKLIPHLTGLTPGDHGFHVHVNPSCDNAGMAAGGHFDPDHSGHHLGPTSDKGHLGDLPVLVVDQNGNANTPVVAPRLTTSLIKGHSLMIHAGGDNYSDTPENGGGGARIACGVIPQQ